MSQSSEASMPLNNGELDGEHPWKDKDPEEEWEKQDKVSSCMFEKGQYNLRKKWKTGNKIDMKEVMKDLPSFLEEMKEKSNAITELKTVVKQLQPLCKLLPNELEKLMSSVTITDNIDLDKMKEKSNAITEVEMVVKQLQPLCELLPNLPIANEILKEEEIPLESYNEVYNELEKLICLLSSMTITDNIDLDKMKEKSNAITELKMVVKQLQPLCKLLPNLPIANKILKEEEIPLESYNEAYNELEKPMSSLTIADNIDLPLSKEIIDKQLGRRKTSESSVSSESFNAKPFSEELSKESELQDLTVLNLHDSERVTMQMSLPGTNYKSFEDMLKKFVRYVFIPSYRRANCAQLDWSNAGIDLSKTLQILVVRPSEFEEYKEWHGGRFPIISLPSNMIGIGYARYWIQMIAMQCKLPYIWMLDDDIRCFYEKSPDYEEKNLTGVREKKFEVVFSEIEEYVKKATNFVAMSPVVHGQPKLNALPFIRKPPRAAVFLHLERIEAKGVYYRRGLLRFEDMLFAAECEEKDLGVLLWNRIHVHVLQFKNTGAHSPYKSKPESPNKNPPKSVKKGKTLAPLLDGAASSEEATTSTASTTVKLNPRIGKKNENAETRDLDTSTTKSTPKQRCETCRHHGHGKSRKCPECPTGKCSPPKKGVSKP